MAAVSARAGIVFEDGERKDDVTTDFCDASTKGRSPWARLATAATIAPSPTITLITSGAAVTTIATAFRRTAFTTLSPDTPGSARVGDAAGPPDAPEPPPPPPPPTARLSAQN